MVNLLPTRDMSSNAVIHRARVRKDFGQWLRSLTCEQVKERSLVNLPVDEETREQNKEATVSEAQHRANQSSIEFTVFSVGNGLFGIVPSDSYHASFGTKVETGKPEHEP